MSQGTVVKGVMKRIALVGVLAVVASSLSWASPASAQWIDPPPSGPLLSRIVGYVENDIGERLEGIEVSVTTYASDAPAVVDVTDVNGDYTLDVTNTPPDGAGYVVTFTDSADFYGRQVYSSLYLQPGYDEVLVIEMVEGGRVGGVISTGGAPLDGVCGGIYGAGDDDLVPYGEFCSGPGGAYETDALGPGEYVLSVFEDGYFEVWETVTVVSGTTSLVDVDLLTRAGTGSATLVVDVVSDDDGMPVASCVYVYDGVSYQYECSETGSVSFTGLEPGSYQASVSPTDGRHTSAWSAVTVVDGANAVVVAVPLGGRIEGTVTASDGVTPLAGVRVDACYSSFCGSGVFSGLPYTYTDEQGGYSFEGLFATFWAIRFSGVGFNTQFWDGTPETGETPELPSALLLPVTLGSVTTGIDARMTARDLLSITGTVVDAVSSVGIENAAVRVRATVNGYLRTVGAVSTDSAGNYQIDGLEPGTYEVSVAAIGYVSERFDDAKNGTTLPTPVVLEVGGPVPDVSFALDPQGVIQGTVDVDLPPVSGSGFYGMPYYCVTATPVETSFAPVRRCQPLGTSYRLAKLPAGEYSLQIESYDYRPQTIEGVVVEPAVGGDVTTQNFALQRRPVIWGTVLDSTLQPVSNVTVCAYDEFGVWAGCGYSRADGTYGVVVDEGTYTVSSNSYAYVPEWYPELASAPAAPNVVVDSVGATGIDFTLDRKPQLTVTAVIDGGSPACNLPIVVLRPDGSFVTETQIPCYAQSDGVTTFVLDVGTYKLRFGGRGYFGYGDGLYAQEFWQDQSTLDAATRST
jgi:protocatechuate 3,4-dioxygenase beta subunit